MCFELNNINVLFLHTIINNICFICQKKKLMRLCVISLLGTNITLFITHV